MAAQVCLVERCVAGKAQDLVEKFGAEAIEHRHDHDQRRHTQQDAEEREQRNDRDETFLAPRPQIAERQHPLEAGKGFGIGKVLVPSGWQKAPHDLGPARTFSRSPVLRFLTSAMPSFRPRGPMITCQGRPIRSMAANLPPAPLVPVVVENLDALGLQRRHRSSRHAASVSASPTLS